MKKKRSNKTNEEKLAVLNTIIEGIIQESRQKREIQLQREIEETERWYHERNLAY